MKRLMGAVLICASAMFAASKQEVEQRIEEAARVFTEIMQIEDKAIPKELLEKAHCIAVVPGAKKGGFIVGAKYGKGLMTCRDSSSPMGWTGVSMVRVEGGSIGAQIGAGEVDVVLVVMNEKGAERLMNNSFTLGAEAGVMAGPVGRDAQAKTDAFMTAAILSYSRARGAFAGATLDGATLRYADEDTEAIYEQPVTHKSILMGKVKPPSEAKPFYEVLNQSAPTAA
ncbi:MAG: lipid-binding SYLF domain-containing protein, partial [Bryobacteraceae bacterium]